MVSFTCTKLKIKCILVMKLKLSNIDYHHNHLTKKCTNYYNEKKKNLYVLST